MQILITALLCGNCSVKSGNKIESLQERAIRFLPEDNSLCYEDLFEKARNLKMRVSNIRILCIKIYKTTNGLNLSSKKIYSKKNCLRGFLEINADLIMIFPIGI